MLNSVRKMLNTPLRRFSSMNLMQHYQRFHDPHANMNDLLDSTEILLTSKEMETAKYIPLSQQLSHLLNDYDFSVQLLSRKTVSETLNRITEIMLEVPEGEGLELSVKLDLAKSAVGEQNDKQMILDSAVDFITKSEQTVLASKVKLMPLLYNYALNSDKRITDLIDTKFNEAVKKEYNNLDIMKKTHLIAYLCGSLDESKKAQLETVLSEIVSNLKEIDIDQLRAVHMLFNNFGLITKESH